MKSICLPCYFGFLTGLSRLVLTVMAMWFPYDHKEPGKREKKKPRPRHRI